MSPHKRVLIVGGVAGGASCAARLRRLDENAQIIIFERGPYVSFATCGLPYYIGNVIQDEQQLLVASPELFQRRFNIEVRTGNEVTLIDRLRREIEVCELATGRLYRQPYDALVLSPGASPIRPSWPGIHLPGIFTLRAIPDSRRIREWIETRNPRRAVIVGGGSIGLEIAENLVHRGLKLTIVELLPQLMPALDPEMAEPISRHLETHRVALHLGDGAVGFDATRLITSCLSPSQSAGFLRIFFPATPSGIMNPFVGHATYSFTASPERSDRAPFPPRVTSDPFFPLSIPLVSFTWSPNLTSPPSSSASRTGLRKPSSARCENTLNGRRFSIETDTTLSCLIFSLCRPSRTTAQKPGLALFTTRRPASTPASRKDFPAGPKAVGWFLSTSSLTG